MGPKCFGRQKVEMGATPLSEQKFAVFANFYSKIVKFGPILTHGSFFGGKLWGKYLEGMPHAPFSNVKSELTGDYA